MTIRQLFQKPIDRDIKGVVKVGQGEDENIRQELEEYVVTRELQRHFAEFFAAYKTGITGQTDKMGVWISGFFGSGKSHFLKILAYLLENRTVDGRCALDYFLADQKISDPMVLADMQLAANPPADVILFNIDSKGESTGKQDKDAIVSVFLKAFNEMQGFCGAYPAVADLERRLTEQNQYDAFCRAFAEAGGGDWCEERYGVDFVQDALADALAGIGFMSAEAARSWCEKATEPYAISIERFAELVGRYIRQRGGNHHVVFAVDEIGQYIGEDSRLMLNLQTVTEDLGTACQGKAWVIVTSQEDIDSITKIRGNDFSKIQGRFDTRLSLSAANVSEVIQKRILQKTEPAAEALRLLYDEKATVIKNLVLFNDGIEKKLYAGREDFAAVYPFIPYQFDLLGSVLTSIRTYGASGKHLSDGARSMLALFQESALRIKDEQPGALIPFHFFYEPLENFIDHSHKDVICRALENEYLNPRHEQSCFAVDVLKTLFMIKYVKEIKATAEQVTSLMASQIGEDRLALAAQVEAALKQLTRQTLVQKSGNAYVFLTNEEQEINRAVESQPIEPDEVRAKAAEMIFDGIYDEKKYRFSAMNGRYSFAFNQVVDDKPYKAGQNHPLTLKILTPDSDELADEQTMRMLSSQSRCVLAVLPGDRTFLDELRAALQIEKFIRFDTINDVAKYARIKADKQAELREHLAQARLFLEESLKNAALYVGGSRLQSPARDVASRLHEAMGRLAETVYHKLSYIDTPTAESDIRALFCQNARQLTLAGAAAPANQLALRDLADFIARNTQRRMKTSMKAVMEFFSAPPYGFVEADVQWLTAKLFRDGELSMTVNSEPVTLLNKSPEELVRCLTRKEYLEKLLLEKRERAGERQKKAVRETARELFGVSLTAEDDDTLLRDYLRCAASLKEQLDRLEARYASQPRYPGRQTVREGQRLLTELLQPGRPSEFFEGVDARRDSLLDLAEDYEPIKRFFAGEQLGIFDRALHLSAIYEQSKTYIVDETIETLAAQVEEILRRPAPYGEIYRLPGLLDAYAAAYSEMLGKARAPVLEAVRAARARVLEELEGKPCYDALSARFAERFEELRQKAHTGNNLAALQGIALEADALKVRCLNEIHEAIQAAPPADTHSGGQDVPPPAKPCRSVSIRSITNQNSWQLQTPEDVRRCTAELEQKLLAALEEGAILSVEL